jgi:hypothetical protein
MYKLVPTWNFDIDELNSRLASLGQRCPKLAEYLKKICNPNPDVRYSTGEMWACLNSYSANICQLRDFSPKDSAEKTAINEFKNKMAKIKAQKTNDY